MNDKYISRDNLELVIDGLKVGMTPDWNENDNNEFGYIRNKPFYTEYGAIVDNYSGEIPRPKCIFDLGKMYDVIWNGTRYNGLVCYAPDYNDGFRAIGGDGYPFYIETGGSFYVEPESGYTVSVLGDIVHQLDEKYIPDSVARVEDIEVGFENIFTEIDSQKMNATDPVGTGSFSMNRKEGTNIGNYSHAEGYKTTASGVGAHAEGIQATASGGYSHVEGCNNIASGDYSHAEGGNAFANGGRTTASGEASHAEGAGTTASGLFSHAEGRKTTASGHYSHAEGSETNATAAFAHAEGDGTTASGEASHAEGTGTSTMRMSQHVQGENNIIDTYGDGIYKRGKYAHIVGNGSSIHNRSNAHTLDWGGNAWFAGDVYTGSTSGTNKDEGSKKLATEEYVNNMAGGERWEELANVTLDNE